MYFDSVEDRKKACEREKRCYVNLLGDIQIIRSVAKEFDGKVLNSRFSQRLTERLNHYAKIEFTSDYMQICVYNVGLQCGYTYSINLDTLNRTESGKYRMDAEKFCNYISGKCAVSLKERISRYNTNKIDEAREEFRKIAQELNEFKKKYSYETLSFAGCSFRLKDEYLGDSNLIY